MNRNQIIYTIKLLEIRMANKTNEIVYENNLAVSTFNEAKQVKILIIGLWEIGYSNAEYMTKMGLPVSEIDP